VEAEKGQEDLTTRVKPAMAMALVNMRNRWVGAVLRSEGTFVRMTGCLACRHPLSNKGRQ
jgi:hypothetical protein